MIKSVRKLFIAISAVLIFCSPAVCAVDFESTNTEYMWQADGLSTDINGANQAISICLWATPESLSGEPTMVSKFGSLTQDQFIFFMVDRGGGWHVEFIVDGSGDFGTSEAGISADGSVAAGSLYFICGVSNDTDIRIYINGSLSGSPVSYTGGLFNGTSQFRIGIREYSDTHPFDGVLDDVYVWNVALTSTEVAAIYNSTLKGFGRQIQSASLQLYCAFDQCPVGTDNCSSAFNCSPGSSMTPVNTPSGAVNTNLNLPMGIQ